MTTLSDLTWETLEAWGFERDECPDDAMRSLPRDVTAVDSRDLMLLFTHFTEWKCYAAARLAESECRVAGIKQDLKIVTNQAALRATEERTVAGRKAVASLDLLVQDAEQQLLTAESLVTALRMVLGNSDDRRTLVSRELSRRQAEAPNAARASKWSI